MPCQRRSSYAIRDLRLALGLFDLGLNAAVARLAVLYEDLRIELMASTEPTVPFADTNGVDYRKNYFMRRAIATLVEFAEGIRLLDGAEDFRQVKGHFSHEAADWWREAVDFFRKQERFLERIRNDIGGHFGVEAAKYAVSHIPDRAVGVIRIDVDSERHTADIHFVFAESIVATAIGKHRGGSESFEHYVHRAFDVAFNGFTHATRATQVIAKSYLLGRFEFRTRGN